MFGFDFFLTEKLGWQSVERMRREMPAEEYMQWGVYHGRRAQAQELARLKAGG